MNPSSPYEEVRAGPLFHNPDGNCLVQLGSTSPLQYSEIPFLRRVYSLVVGIHPLKPLLSKWEPPLQPANPVVLSPTAVQAAETRQAKQFHGIQILEVLGEDSIHSRPFAPKELFSTSMTSGWTAPPQSPQPLIPQQKACQQV